MTTKAQALDHLTDALAGEDVAGEPTVAGAIDKLARMIEDGEITIGGGGGGVVEIPFEIDATTHLPVCTKTASEIIAIIESGKQVKGVLSGPGIEEGTTTTEFYNLANYTKSDTQPEVNFVGYNAAGSSIVVFYFTVQNDTTSFVTGSITVDD